MSVKLAIVMDNIADINIDKDSSFAMLLAASHRCWHLYYIELPDLCLKDGAAWANIRPLTVTQNSNKWYSLGKAQLAPIEHIDVVLMRKDPPFNMEYIYATYILEQAEAGGCLVVNKPKSLRDANEKLYTYWFNQYMPPTLVASNYQYIADFYQEHRDIIIKPLDNMGGNLVFRVQSGDTNFAVIVATLTNNGNCFCMVQKFIKEIIQGDKRILVVNGEVIPYSLARIPKMGEIRGNLAAGATGRAQALTKLDQEIAHNVAPVLKEQGIMFAGLDVIGNYLTEINVTSPTGICELERAYNVDITGKLMTAIDKAIN